MGLLKDTPARQDGPGKSKRNNLKKKIVKQRASYRRRVLFRARLTFRNGMKSVGGEAGDRFTFRRRSRISA